MKIKRLWLGLLAFPFSALAHLISITATTPFPAEVSENTVTTATFIVTNVSSHVNITAVNQSIFSLESGLSIASSTCDKVLAPGESCMVQITLRAATAGRVVNGTLRQWAKPTIDAVEFPFSVRVSGGVPSITLVPVDSSALPALRQPIVAAYGDNWLIVSGSTGNFHDFNNNFNDSLYVYNPQTLEMHSVLIADTNLPDTVKQQLATTSPQSLHDGDTLYIIGGYYNETQPSNRYFTIKTITSIDIPGMMNAIINQQTNLLPFVHVSSPLDEFFITGGQLGKIGNDFYMAFGQLCTGFYCLDTQVYTNAVYRFSMDPALANVVITDQVSHPEFPESINEGWRRRDYALVPLMTNNQEALFAMGGPFTPGHPLVWTNGLLFDGDLNSNSHFINQQGNQYISPYLSMYSASRNTSYIATFSGLSNLYWSTAGLIYDKEAPYGNVLDLISYEGSGVVQEYVNLQPLCSGQPLASCLYMGLTATFIAANPHYNSRHILQLDDLPQDTPTLVGYVYGGLISSDQHIFGNNASRATNQVYAVYLTPGGKIVEWENVTNRYPGN